MNWKRNWNNWKKKYKKNSFSNNRNSYQSKWFGFWKEIVKKNLFHFLIFKKYWNKIIEIKFSISILIELKLKFMK